MFSDFICVEYKVHARINLMAGAGVGNDVNRGGWGTMMRRSMASVWMRTYHDRNGQKLSRLITVKSEFG